VKVHDTLVLSHLRDVKDLRITGIKLSAPVAESSHAFDWLPALLMSTSSSCRTNVESLYLSFALEAPKDMDRVAWGEIEHALSSTRFPQLKNIRLHFTVYAPGLTQAEVAKRLPDLALRGTVKIVELKFLGSVTTTSPGYP
jgi:hypothetical protein